MWGKGECGQLGLGDMHGSLVPRQLTALALERIARVSCGAVHTLAVTEKGSVYVWGHGSDGQLGLGLLPEGCTDVVVPRKIAALERECVVAVSGGARHSCVLTAKGDLYSWGLGDDGRLGIELKGGKVRLHEPIHIEVGESRVRIVSAGGQHTAVCTESGQVLTCGRGTFGQLGHGNEDDQMTFKPVCVCCVFESC